MAQVIPFVFGVLLPWLLVGVGGWLVFQLIHQNGRLLLKLEALEARLGELAAAAPASAPPAAVGPQGLAVGTPAPGFELPDLSGKKRSLAEFRGRRVLLVFFGPRCGYCLEMLPRIAALPTGAGGGPVPLVLTSGDLAENRTTFEGHGVGCPVLVQGKTDVAAMYQAFGTPVGYLIDEQGAIASELAVGSDAVLELAGPPPPGGGNGNGNGNGHAAGRGAGNRPLSTSRLVRDGLKAGTPAPDVRLPKVGGGEVALRDYRGRRVLLVFSDPQCGPCDELAPRLEELHRRTSDPQVVMVSRRDMGLNRKKVDAAGLTFPVAVQKNWETSRDYGMFATPIGYLIDDRGVIAADVAVGPDAILALAASPAPAPAEGAGSAPCLDGSPTDRAAVGR